MDISIKAKQLLQFITVEILQEKEKKRKMVSINIYIQNIGIIKYAEEKEMKMDV